jgi:hypothetical protein
VEDGEAAQGVRLRPEGLLRGINPPQWVRVRVREVRYSSGGMRYWSVTVRYSCVLAAVRRDAAGIVTEARVWFAGLERRATVGADLVLLALGLLAGARLDVIRRVVEQVVAGARNVVGLRQPNSPGPSPASHLNIAVPSCQTLHASRHIRVASRAGPCWQVTGSGTLTATHNINRTGFTNWPLVIDGIDRIRSIPSSQSGQSCEPSVSRHGRRNAVAGLVVFLPLFTVTSKSSKNPCSSKRAITTAARSPEKPVLVRMAFWVAGLLAMASASTALSTRASSRLWPCSFSWCLLPRCRSATWFQASVALWTVTSHFRPEKSSCNSPSSIS